MQEKVFDSVRCEFLVVGHTGNEVDQCFSILTNELKNSEILSVESLKEKIVNSPIQPKPICRSLLFIWDWKKFIESKLADTPLVNHSKYNSFLLDTDRGNVKFRGKLLPQLPDTELYPRSGIRLVKENTTFESVGVADFRVEEIKFDDILKGLNRFSAMLPLEKKMQVMSSWENLRRLLESLPNKKNNFPRLKLEDLPKQRIVDEVQVPDYLKDRIDAVENTLTGELYPEEAGEGNLAEIDVGTDVVVYTDEVGTRPWVGRVTQLLAGEKFEIHWFRRKSGRGSTFHAMRNQLGHPVLSVLDLESIMFWHMSEKRTEESFSLSPYWIEAIRNEYESLDS